MFIVFSLWRGTRPKSFKLIVSDEFEMHPFGIAIATADVLQQPVP